MGEAVAYLGPAGTFTEAALIKLGERGVFGPDWQAIPSSSPAAAIEAVDSRRAGFACVAIENSVEGPVTSTFDALARHEGVQIFAEVDVEIAFSIVVRRGTSLDEISTFATHPVAMRQVEGWLARHLPGVEVTPTSSNSTAAHAVKQGLIDAAAAPHRAAELLGLDEIVRGVADVEGARTRFVAVGPAGPPPARTGHDRTSVTFLMPNFPGSLVEALTQFAARGVDLTRIESRPTREGLGTYRFYADLAGHIDDAPVREALTALYRRAGHIQYLGSWPAEARDFGDTYLDTLDEWNEAAQWVDSLRGPKHSIDEDE